MINLRKYEIENSVKAGRKLYVPKRYLAGFVLRHIGEKASSIFKLFCEVFGSNNTHRKEYDSFIESTFELGEVKKIIALKDQHYEGMVLSNDYPFTNSLLNGLQIVKEILGGIDLADITEEVLYKVMEIRLDQVKEVCERNSIINCGINQNIFDFVIARECLLNKQYKKADEIALIFYEVLFASELISNLIDNIKVENREKCLKTLRMMSLTTYDPRFELRNIDELKDMPICDIFYYVGANLNILVNVLNYFSEQGEDVVPQMFLNYISSLDKDLFDILSRREKETLDSIGQSYGVTRERIRQIEEKGITAFNEFYLDNFCSETKNLIFVFPVISGVFSLDFFKEKMGENYNCFRNLMKSIRYAGSAKYCADLDAIVESEDVYNFFIRISNEILGNYFKKSEFNDKINELLESLSDYGFNDRIIKKYIESAFKDKGSAFVRIGFRLSKAFEVEAILIEHFDDGFHFSEAAHVNKLNEYALEEFGDVVFTDEDINSSHCHTIQAVLERAHVRMVDRGTYVHESKAVDLPIELVEKIINYLNEKNRPVAYSNLFETFQEELLELGISNKYALQGAMSIYEGELFKGKRDYVMPVEMQQTLRESIYAWISSRQGLFTYEDFESEFKGVAMSVFMTALYEVGGTAYYWQQGYLNVKNLVISEETKLKLRQLLNLLIGQYHMEYCSADEIFNLVDIQMHDFIINSGMKYSYDLFSVLQVLFAGEYKFKRPLIGSKDAVFENSLEIIDGYLASRNTVKFDKMRKFVDTKTGHNADVYVTVFEIIKNKWNEFVAIDSDTMVRKETINITEREIVRLDVIIEMILEQKDKVFIKEDLFEKFYFTEIAKMKVNTYILMGLVNTFLHDKYEIIMESKMYKNGSFSIKMKE